MVMSLTNNVERLSENDVPPLDSSSVASPINGGAYTESSSSMFNDGNSDGGSALDGGEWEILLEGLEEPSPPLAPSIENELKRTMSLSGMLSSTSGDSYYGSPLSPEEAKERMPPGDEGLKWHALVIPDAFFNDGRLVGGLNKRDFDAETQKIKPRRPSLPITATDLLSSLTKVEGENGPRYIFHGVLNGWPALRCFELLSLEQRRQGSLIIPSPKEILTGQISWTNMWRSHVEGANGVSPGVPDGRRIYRATLRGAPWTSRGWSKSSPGFVWWFEPHRPDSKQKLSYGTNLLEQLEDDAKCTQIHLVAHRYAVRHESPRDRLTYHSVCLLEWDHGNYCTVVECAYLNGMGGYNGKSNWCDDRDSGISSLYKALPPEMICPWRMSSAEIRCLDVSSKNLDEFKEYIARYEGKDKRFVDPHFSFSHPARLTFRSKKHLAQYFLNYIQRDSTYGELKRNCQTFCADLVAFLAGKKDIVPFHPVSRIEYLNRTYLFLYDSNMYETREEKKNKKQALIKKK
ncbi:hypothetical protein ACA910_005298 [Epithemia clementina (nom. ined.)]